MQQQQQAQNESFYTFAVEWFDAQASLVRSYNLRYYLNDGQIDLFDVKAKRTFLKKCQYPSVTLADLYIGSQITVYARQLKIVAYADDYTRKHLQDAKKVLSIHGIGESAFHPAPCCLEVYGKYTIGSFVIRLRNRRW